MAKFMAQYLHIIIFTLALIVIFWAIYILRSVLLPFALGLIIAYILFPAVLWVEKHLPRHSRWMAAKRVSIIVLIYLVVLGILALIGYYTIPAIIDSIKSLINGLPTLVPTVIQKIQNLISAFQKTIPPEAIQQVNSYLSNLFTTIGSALQSTFLTGLSSIPATLGLVLGFVTLPIFVFYLIKDAESLQEGLFSSLPLWLAGHTRNIISILQSVLGRYIRAQLLMGVIIGVVDFIWLSVLGIPFAPALALLSGTMELVPILGPWIGGSIGVIVTLATKPERVVWVIVAYAVVQILEGNVLSPRVTGSIMRIHPAVILILIVLAAHLAGLWGVVLVVPVTATLVPIYKYLLKSTKEAGAQVPPKIL
jgi:predicted PurR-regulated permease PerM